MKAVLFTFLFLFLNQAFAAAWSHQPDRVWNDEWESKYSAWFQSSVGTDWLQKENFLFHKWAVDCAKFTYLVRLYFSYENGLEFAIRDHRRSGQIISSRSSNWDSISDPQKRVRAFADFILKQVNTSTLPQDTYLLSLDKASVRAGTILAGDRQRAHTWLISQVRPSGVPVLIFATLPGSEYLYLGYGFPPETSVFYSGKLPSDDQGGFRQFRWPQDLLKPARELSRRSADQTLAGKKVQFESFFDGVQSILRLVPRNENDEFSYLLDDFCAKVRGRVNAIIDAGQALQKLGGGRFSKAQEDLYSTPKRDSDILNVIRQIDAKYALLSVGISDANMKRYSSLLRPRWTSDDECLIAWADNRLEPLGAIRTRFLLGRMSSSPYDSFAKRWGE